LANPNEFHVPFGKKGYNFSSCHDMPKWTCANFSFSFSYGGEMQNKTFHNDSHSYSYDNFLMVLTSGCDTGKYASGTGKLDCAGGHCDLIDSAPANVIDGVCKTCSGIISSSGFECTPTLHAPTLAPTKHDQVSVSVNVVMTTTQSTISAKETNTLMNAVALSLGLDVSTIQDFTVVITQARRRLLVSSYIWTVSFSVVTSLSSTPYTSTAALSSGISSLLTSNLEANVQSSLGLVVLEQSVTVTASTRSPSMAPTSTPKRKNETATLAVGAIIGIAIACFIVFVAVIAGIVFTVMKKKKDKDSTIVL